MNQKAVDKIMTKVKKEWVKRFAGIDMHYSIDMMSKFLLGCPDNDGMKRVEYEGKTYLVPYEDIILNGLKATDIPTKYKVGK